MTRTTVAGGRRLSIMTALVGVTLLAPLPAAGQDANVRTLERDGLKLELAPIEPDAVRAFFLGRGFRAEDAELLVGQGCMFRSAIGSAAKSADAPPVTVSLTRWRVTPTGAPPRPPLTREDWERTWAELKVAEDASVAFYWALFPTEQTFSPNDYNWGMLTFGLGAGTGFALDVAWSAGGKDHTERMEGLACAK